jgi:hypothetical protein
MCEGASCTNSIMMRDDVPRSRPHAVLAILFVTAAFAARPTLLDVGTVYGQVAPQAINDYNFTLPAGITSFSITLTATFSSTQGTYSSAAQAFLQLREGSLDAL